MTDRELMQQDVLNLLKYDRETGVFIWRVDSGNRKGGTIAGSKDAHGYTVITINGRRLTSLQRMKSLGGWHDR